MILALAVVAPGCQKRPAADRAQPTAAQAATLTPEELGQLGARIMREPDKTKDLLAEEGLNEQQFEEQVRRVSENRDEARRYAAAFKKQI